DEVSVRMFTEAAERVLGEDSVVPTEQSLGGDDFGWYLESTPGAYARLGVRKPGSGEQLDIHQGTFDVDESCIGMGVRFMAATALTALWEDRRLSTGQVAEALT